MGEKKCGYRKQQAKASRGRKDSARQKKVTDELYRILGRAKFAGTNRRGTVVSWSKLFVFLPIDV